MILRISYDISDFLTGQRHQELRCCINNEETFYFTQLKMWPGNHLVPCVAELVGSCILIHAHRCLPNPKCLFYPSFTAGKQTWAPRARESSVTHKVSGQWLQHAWWQVLVGGTTSHQCYSDCTGYLSVSECPSRLPGSCISHWTELCQHISSMTVVCCLKLVVAQHGWARTIFGLWSNRAHTIATATEVSRLPVPKFGISFHRDFDSRVFYSLHFKNIWRLTDCNRIVTLISVLFAVFKFPLCMYVCTYMPNQRSVVSALRAVGNL